MLFRSLVWGSERRQVHLVNALTGARQHTTNAPGTTVELATGTWRTAWQSPAGHSTVWRGLAGPGRAHSATERAVVDLPGTYSLLAHASSVTADAVTELARDFGEGNGQPGVVVIVLDATALAR